MRLRKFTRRKSPATGKPYPQCQHVSGKQQCEKPVYSDGLCWKHYRGDARTVLQNNVMDGPQKENESCGNNLN